MPTRRPAFVFILLHSAVLIILPLIVVGFLLIIFIYKEGCGHYNKEQCSEKLPEWTLRWILHKISTFQSCFIHYTTFARSCQGSVAFNIKKWKMNYLKTAYLSLCRRYVPAERRGLLYPQHLFAGGNDDAVLGYGKAPEGYMSSIYLQIMKSAGDSVTITHILHL